VDEILIPLSGDELLIMAERIIIGKNGTEVGMFVARPGGNAATKTNMMINSSQEDMLRIMTSGVHTSLGTYVPGEPWPFLHDFTITYPSALPYIPLVLFGIKLSADEPFQFPPDFGRAMPIAGSGYNGRIAINHQNIRYIAFSPEGDLFFHYMVFYNKMYDIIV
jgi:hypothetical protein